MPKYFATRGQGIKQQHRRIVILSMIAIIIRELLLFTGNLMAGLSVHVINLQMIIISMFMNGDDGSVLDRQVLQSLFAAVAAQNHRCGDAVPLHCGAVLVCRTAYMLYIPENRKSAVCNGDTRHGQCSSLRIATPYTIVLNRQMCGGKPRYL